MEQTHAGLLHCSPCVLRVVVGPYTSSSGPTCRCCVLPAVFGPYVSSLGPTHRGWGLTCCPCSSSPLLFLMVSHCSCFSLPFARVGFVVDLPCPPSLLVNPPRPPSSFGPLCGWFQFALVATVSFNSLWLVSICRGWF